MQTGELTDEQIVQSLQVKIDALYKQIDKYKGIINTLRPTVESQPEKLVSKRDESKGDTFIGTFKETILAMLTDVDKPVTVKEALSKFAGLVSKEPSYQTFSGQFSTLVNKNPTLIKKYVIPENPISERYYYGLTRWFDGEELKDEYKAKIKKARGSALLALDNL